MILSLMNFLINFFVVKSILFCFCFLKNTSSMHRFASNVHSSESHKSFKISVNLESSWDFLCFCLYILSVSAMRQFKSFISWKVFLIFRYYLFSNWLFPFIISWGGWERLIKVTTLPGILPPGIDLIMSSWMTMFHIVIFDHWV